MYYDIKELIDQSKMPKFEKNIEKSHEKNFTKAKILFSNHKYEKAAKLLLENYNYYKSKNNLIKAYEALEKYIICLTKMGYIHNELGKVEELLKYSKEINNEEYKAFAYATMGIIYQTLGDFEKALTFNKKAQSLYRKLEYYENLIPTYTNISNSYYFLGDFVKSIQTLKAAEKICLERNILSWLSGIYHKMCFNYIALNDMDELFECYAKMGKYFKHVSDVELKLRLLNNLRPISYFKENRDEEVYQFLLQLLEECHQNNFIRLKAQTLRTLAILCIDQEKYDEAKKYLDQALDISKKYNFEIDIAITYNNLAELESKKNKITKAIMHVNQSIKLSKKHHNVPLIIRGHKLLGEFYKTSDLYEKSYYNYRKALDYYLKITETISTVEQKEQFREVYQQLPDIIEELSNFIDSKDIKLELEEVLAIGSISKKACSMANQQYYNFISEECRQKIKNLQKLSERLMQLKLEDDARQLFRKRDDYEIETTGKNITMDPDQVDLLYDKKCIKNKSKGAEIDVYGLKKLKQSKITYILGECTFTAKSKIAHKIKCFFTKVSIISKDRIAIDVKFDQIKPKFHLIFISMQGFPDDIHLKQMKKEFLSIPSNRIVGIEYIDADYFLRLLKDQKLPIAEYRHYYSYFNE